MVAELPPDAVEAIDARNRMRAATDVNQNILTIGRNADVSATTDIPVAPAQFESQALPLNAVPDKELGGYTPGA